MTHTFRLIRRLAKDLKYLPLELLWNYPITINSVATVEQDIRQELGKIVPAECQLLTTSEMMVGMLKKYQFLDLTAQVPDALLLRANYHSGMLLLRQLLPQNYIEDGIEPKPMFDDDDELDSLNFSEMFLEGLADDLNTGITVCRMWIESRSRQSFEERFEAEQQNKLSSILARDYFPHDFVIRDACLTNAKGVWFFKYLYI